MPSSPHLILALLLFTPGSTSMAHTLMLAVSCPGLPPDFLLSNRAHWVSAHVLPASTENSIRDGCEATYALPSFSQIFLQKLGRHLSALAFRKEEETGRGAMYEIATKLTKTGERTLDHLVHSQHYLTPTAQMLGPAQSTPIAQLQTVPATAYPCK